MNFDLRKIFDLGHIFSTPNDIFGPYFTAFFIIVTIGALVSNFVYFYGKYRFKNNLLTYTLLNRGSRNAAIAFSLGFFFALSRIARLQPFNARVFLYISVILLIYYTVRGIGYMIRTYPKAKAEWQNQQERSSKKVEPRSSVTAAIRPATAAPAAAKPKVVLSKAVPAGSLAGGSGDAGGEDVADDAASQVQEENLPIRVVPRATTTTGSSERALKRRERKRSKR